MAEDEVLREMELRKRPNTSMSSTSLLSYSLIYKIAENDIKVKTKSIEPTSIGWQLLTKMGWEGGGIGMYMDYRNIISI